MYLKLGGLIFLVVIFAFSTMDFKSDQMKSSRVRTAYTEKENQVINNLADKNIDIKKLEIFIRVFKKEKIVELWGKNKTDNKYKKLQSFDFCQTSGVLGPKRRQGDMQIPEGFYHIDRFNSWSNFYLSLGINYPNQSDKILGKSNPGGDIFIHGDCVTIGCIPITDDKIKELYLYALEAKNNGQVYLFVHIFPGRMDEENFKILSDEYKDDTKLLDFWKNLRAGYNYFESNKSLPTITISNTGEYIFTE